MWHWHWAERGHSLGFEPSNCGFSWIACACIGWQVERVEKPVLLARFPSFMQGDWAALLQNALAREPPDWTNRRAPEARDDDAGARRARHVAHLGKLSAARQALTAAPLAPAIPPTT